MHHVKHRGVVAIRLQIWLMGTCIGVARAGAPQGENWNFFFGGGDGRDLRKMVVRILGNKREGDKVTKVHTGTLFPTSSRDYACDCECNRTAKILTTPMGTCRLRGS